MSHAQLQGRAEQAAVEVLHIQQQRAAEPTETKSISQQEKAQLFCHPDIHTHTRTLPFIARAEQNAGIPLC